MSTSDPWTIKRLLDWTTDYLGKNGSLSPRLDAEVLLAEARSCQRIDLYTAYDQVPEKSELDRFRQWVQLRAAGKPVAYLVGHREFYSLPFNVNEHVLIPRPETELLVTLAIDFLKEFDKANPRVCDVGTGSGCIPIAIANNNPDCQITAIDISSEALAVAESNCIQHKVTDRIDLLKGDLLDDLDDGTRFDLIVSNPPYIGLHEKDKLAPEVRDHEPHLALFAGQDGMAIIQRLVKQAASHLNPGGALMFELSPFIAPAVLNLVESNKDFTQSRIANDLAKQPRVLTARRV